MRLKIWAISKEIAREKKIEFAHQESKIFTLSKKKPYSKSVFEYFKKGEMSHFELQNRGKKRRKKEEKKGICLSKK